MDVKKYIFGDNLIYEIENLNIEVYKTLSNMVNTDTSLLKVGDEDFSSLCNGYKKLMIGFGKISELNNLLFFFNSELHLGQHILVLICIFGFCQNSPCIGHIMHTLILLPT